MANASQQITFSVLVRVRLGVCLTLPGPSSSSSVILYQICYQPLHYQIKCIIAAGLDSVSKYSRDSEVITT